jgi:hypothetical protein
MGENVPLGGIFANKKYTGKVAEIHQEVSDSKRLYDDSAFVLEGRKNLFKYLFKGYFYTWN